MPRSILLNSPTPMLRISEDALTFDDVLLLPDYSAVVPKDVDLTAKLTRDINLNFPLLSAAMDTVTESAMAIAMGQEGGIGIIHKSMSVSAQAKQVIAVKKYELQSLRHRRSLTFLRSSVNTISLVCP